MGRNAADRSGTLAPAASSLQLLFFIGNRDWILEMNQHTHQVQEAINGNYVAK